MTRACRVVLADDMLEFRLLVRLQLKQDERFAIVGEAADGAEAIRIVDQEKPDVLLLDLAMPVMDGLQVIPQIRSRSPATRIVVLSGFEEGHMGSSIRSLGAHAYVQKAGNFGELIETLEHLCPPPV
jgi:YesN/AraC family two-component response regulator